MAKPSLIRKNNATNLNKKTSQSLSLKAAELKAGAFCNWSPGSFHHHACLPRTHLSILSFILMVSGMSGMLYLPGSVFPCIPVVAIAFSSCSCSCACACVSYTHRQETTVESTIKDKRSVLWTYKSSCGFSFLCLCTQVLFLYEFYE